MASHSSARPPTSARRRTSSAESPSARKPSTVIRSSQRSGRTRYPKKTRRGYCSPSAANSASVGDSFWATGPASPQQGEQAAQVRARQPVEAHDAAAISLRSVLVWPQDGADLGSVREALGRSPCPRVNHRVPSCCRPAWLHHDGLVQVVLEPCLAPPAHQDQPGPQHRAAAPALKPGAGGITVPTGARAHSRATPVLQDPPSGGDG